MDVLAKSSNHYIPIHPDNVANNEWIIVLEAGTIVGPSPDKLRVAVATLERKIVKKFDILLRAKRYLVVDGYDPRIHALYFCPQLYKSDSDGTLVALEGEEIGKLLAKLVEGAVAQKQPRTTRPRNHQTSRSFPLHPWETWTALSSIPQPGKPLQLAFPRTA